MKKNNIVQKALLIAAAACSFCAAAAGNGSQLNSILASVNGTPISLRDVLAVTGPAEFNARNSSSGKELEQKIISIRREAVDKLIDRKLILEDYSNMKFEIPQRDIESALDGIADRMGVRSRTEFEKNLRRQGSSIEELRKNVRETMTVQLMLHREFTASRSITPEKMFEYYRKTQKKRKRSASIELAMIMLDTANRSRTSEIAGELKKDPSKFTELAKKWSSGPGREEGGKLGRIEHRLLRPEFAGVLTAPQAGRIYGPLETREGIVFLKVIKYSVPQQLSFKESIPEIRKKLESEQREASRIIYVQRLRKNAIIRYFF